MRWLATAAAWGLGAVLYVGAAVAWDGYDGLPDMVLVPACGAVLSAVVVALTRLAGRVVFLTPLGRVWRSTPKWPAATAVASALVLAGGSAVGLNGEYADPDTGRRFRALHPAAALGGYALLLFAVAHWPLRPPVAGKPAAPWLANEV